MPVPGANAGSRHLVDPALAPMLDVLPPMGLSAESLDGVRAGLSQMVAAGPDGAALFPGTQRAEHVVPGQPGAPDVRVLVYTPAGNAVGRGALVWMHAGGFVLGAAADDDLLCRQIATVTGTVVVSVDYRLAPETPAPGPLDDCYAALRWLHAGADGLGVSTRRIGVGGSSAGAGLAASLAVLARDRGEVQLAFQVLLYPMLDDRTASTAAAHPYAGEFVWTAADNVYGWSALLGREPGGPGVRPYEAAARVADSAGLPAAFIAVGALDLFAVEDIEYATRLLSAGVPTELHVYPGAFHGFTAVPDAWLTRAWAQAFFAAITRFVDGDRDTTTNPGGII